MSKVTFWNICAGRLPKIFFQMKTLFIGSTRRGFLTLQAMLEAGVQVVGVMSLTQHAHERERYEDAMRELAQTRGIALRETKLAREPELIAWVRSLDAEAAVAVGVRVLLPEGVYSAFPKGCWAVHDSLLPEYRGFAPLNWALINGERTTGVTLFQVSPQMDEGDILLQEALAIGDDDAAPEVYEQVCAATLRVVVQGCALLRAGLPPLRRQEHARATFTCSRAPGNGLIDWNQPTHVIFNLIRALTFPYPGAFTYLEGAQLYLVAAHRVSEPPCYVGRIPGHVVQILSTGEVDVLTGDGVLRIAEVSTDGESKRPPAELIRSVRTKLGIDTVELVTRLAKLEAALAAGTLA